MEKRSTILVGAGLVLLGILSMAITLVAGMLGFNPGHLLLRLWPGLVLVAGLAFVVPPFLVRGKRGLGALFIPGMPVLTTGGILFLASIFNAWEIWSWLWPMEIISLAMGFVFAAIYMRIVWLAIPAVIIGLNGLVFQFCAITGLWHWWSVLWVVEPLSVGLALLVPGVVKNIPGLTTTGLTLCGLAGAMLVMMILILDAWFPLALVGPGLLILAGLAVVGWGLLRPMLLSRSAVE
jgi:hypothetical protein